MGSYINSVLLDNEEVVFEGAYALWDNFWYIVLSLGLFLPFIYWGQKFSEVAVTSQRVISKKGFFSRSVVEYPIKKIETINVSQTFTGRIFNYGNVTITGTGNNNLLIENIKDPEEFKKHLASLCV